MKNLSATDYADKAAVTLEIQQLFQDARKQSNNKGQLSIVLIAAALQGVLEDYKIMLGDLKSALTVMEDSPEKLWLTGRMMFAEAMMYPEYVYDQTLIPKACIGAPPYDVMTAWALGYFASLAPESYQCMRVPMLQSLRDQQMAQDAAAHVSDVLWVLIMGLQAAAYAGYREDYEAILKNMKSLTKAQSCAEIFSCLTRTEASSDYPAWAIGIFCVAAGCMGDQVFFDEASKLLGQAIQTAESWGKTVGQSFANQWKSRAEASMGRVYAALAKAQWSLSHDDTFDMEYPVSKGALTMCV